MSFQEEGGERAGIRTLDLLIKSQLLYRLSYALPEGATRRPRKCAEHKEGGLAGQPKNLGSADQPLRYE